MIGLFLSLSLLAMNNLARKALPVIARKLSLTCRAFMLALLLMLTLQASVSYGQQSSSPLDGKTPSGLAPGSPAGSYALSGFDQVNLFNGSLSFRLPLMKVGGRGSAGYTMMLPIEQKWIVKTGETPPSGVPLMSPNPNWWEGIRPGYSPGVLQGRRAVHETNRHYNSTSESQMLTQIDLLTLTRLTFTTADGTEYELRDKLTGGAPYNDIWFPNPGDHYGFDRGTVFTTADGTSATFVSDEAIKDLVVPQMTQTQRFVIPSGVIYLRDGTRYRIDSGRVSWIRDRQGNQVSFGQGAFATDSLGRAVNITPAPTVPGYDQINFAGYGGAPRAVRVYHDYLGSRLRPNSGYSLQTPYQLFPLNSADTQTQYNPPRVAAVVLPNNESYEFYYNPYGELARVVLPTGGAIEYEWAGGAYEADGVIFRYVTERRVYRDGGSVPESRTVYTREALGGASPIVVQSFAGNSSTLLSESKHYFYGDAFQSMSGETATQGAVSYSAWQEGREYQTESFDIVNNTPVLVQRVEQTWQQPSAGKTWPLTQVDPAETDLSVKSNNPQLTRTVRTLLSPNQTLISVQSFSYDQYNNQTDAYESGNGIDTAPLHPLRHTHTDYLTTNPQNQIDYPQSARILNLPTVQIINEIDPSNGNPTQLARTEMLYDEAVYAPLSYGAMTSWVDPGTTARGQATTTRRWLNTPSGYIESHARYNQAGNVVKAWDGRGQAWETSYVDNYADQVARNTYAYPTQSTSPVPDIGWNTSSTTSLQTTNIYDYSTGLVTKSIDANNQQTTIAYNDDLDRPTRVDHPDGGYSIYEYGRNAWGHFVHTQSLLNSATGLLSDNYSYTDGLGRPSRSFQYENSDPSKPWLTNDTQYDALGRVWRTANTYRSSGAAAAINPSDLWTETHYDGLGRVTSVKTPDGATVMTSYLGNSVTVTDAAGKKRSSYMDGLGRLAVVVEDPGTGKLNYLTEYTYDALDKLRVVKQGDQRRYFMYDSLSRLIRARNPEQDVNTNLNLQDSYSALGENLTNNQWSAAYSYDSNGNLLSRTDARGVTASYDYDNLNRQIKVAYSDGTSTVRYYDGATLGRGRAHYSVSYVNATLPETANLVLSYDAMGRPLHQRQRFWGSGAWGATYDVQRTYDVAGHVLMQTYPSGHTVNYSYDVMGRTASFTGNLGDGVARTYMTAPVFDDAGRMTREQFGTDIPLYNKRHYNVRGQLYDIRLSSVNDEGNWNRGAVVNYYSLVSPGFGASGADNNGNLRIQQHFIPRDDSTITSDSYQQNYDYDALNRLAWASLYDNVENKGFQHYSYDRYGNRTISSDSWGVNELPFTVDAATNRLGVPAASTDVMQYDANGNLKTDTYTQIGTLTYDAENKIVSATNSQGQSSYTYNGEGQRVKRQSAGQTTYQVYGIDGELVAEYAANASATLPQKEYGYRNGELLIAATARTPRINVARATSDQQTSPVATASSTTLNDPALYPGYDFSPSVAIDGDRKSGLKFWRDGTAEFPDYLEVDLKASRQLTEIDVFTLQDNDQNPSEPTPEMTFSLYGIRDFRVEYLTGSGWVIVPNGEVTGNDKVWRKFTFAAVTTAKIRVYVTAGEASRSRIVEVEAYEGSPQESGAGIEWVVTDHLGTPRMVADKSGSLSAIKRHDYLPFGEELFAGVGGRTAGQGYVIDGLRQKFTQYERDIETGLDNAGARYYASMQGRFTSTDPTLKSAKLEIPQSWNRYTYVLNNPLYYVDPDGELWVASGNQDSPFTWVDKCGEGQNCFTIALAFNNNTLRVYGSNNADDITNYQANASGMIDIRDLSRHHDAKFIVANGQRVPEEFLSTNTATYLFAVAHNYARAYPNDEELVYTAGSASDGHSGICPNGPCHSGHDGNEIDLRYMSANGRPLQGDNVYLNADLERTRYLMGEFAGSGFPEAFTGDTARFRSTPADRRTERIHHNHLHIGVLNPAPRVAPPNAGRRRRQ
jgi:RHS repeat-associated protein